MSLKDSHLMLQYIDTLLKYNNYTKAAKDLFISQPYLTQAIKKVEQELGTAIIIRQSGVLHLTEAGKIYYQYLETLETASAKFRHRLLRYTSHQKPKHCDWVSCPVWARSCSHFFYLTIWQNTRMCPFFCVKICRSTMGNVY